MRKELVLSPHTESVRAELTDSQGWGVYAAELRRILAIVIERSDADSLEVGDLLVSRPLPGIYAQLRNGADVSPSEAIDLVEGMAAGSGPYCRLSVPGRLHIVSGWEGAVHLHTTPQMATVLAGLEGKDVSLQWRDSAPEPVAASELVQAVADENFWSAVWEMSERVTLLCERWAHGAYGCRWFLVTRENVGDVAELMRPRSLLSVVGDPDLQPKPEILEDDFTAFTAPLLPGELSYRAFPGGADSLSDVVGEGFSLVLADNFMGNWCVVPDPDGVNRGQWENSGEPWPAGHP
ncbi:hypothetical protein [Streptomyces tailanensis]|uniref:hypothetical protein n=1 Tax=Streptomyces tailanensis TaxID=2569858 RepID=UPI00122E9C8F|nr:hypothetical protein [Streptomyces tailanensis]